MTRRDVKFAWIEWTTGKENFPSVRSSAKPLFLEYCAIERYRQRERKGQFSFRSRRGGERDEGRTNLRRLQVHVVVSDLEQDTDEVD